jgi:hypothetical protein
LKAIKQREEVAAKAYAAIYQKAHTRTWEQWHWVLGHANQKTLEMMAREDPQGMPIIAELNKNYQCEACIKAKQHVAPFSQKLETKYTKVGELVVSDVWGPAQVQSLQGNSYFVSFIDMHSRFSAVYFKKSNKEVRDRYKDFEALVKTQTQNEIKQLQTDEGKEYVNTEFKSYITSKGTIHKLTAAHSLSSNGIAEQLMCTLLDYARATLMQHQLPKFLWQEAVAHVNFIKNRVPTQATKITPHELFFGTKAKITRLEEFGSELWVLDQSGQTRKLDTRSHKYRFMGYGDNSRAFRYYKPDTRQILLTRNAIFVPPNTEEINYEDLEEAELLLIRGVGATVIIPSTPTKSSMPKPGVFTPPAKSTKATTTVAPLQPTTPPKIKPGSSTPAAPPAPKKGQVQPRFVAPLPGITIPSTAPPRRSARTEGIRHDYAKLNCLGRSTLENDQRPEPWKDEVVPPEQVNDDNSSSREVEGELETPMSAETVDYAELEDEWAE